MIGHDQCPGGCLPLRMCFQNAYSPAATGDLDGGKESCRGTAHYDHFPVAPVRPELLCSIFQSFARPDAGPPRKVQPTGDASLRNLVASRLTREGLLAEWVGGGPVSIANPLATANTKRI